MISSLLLCFLFLAPSLLLAQSGGYAGEFSRMGFGPRGMAMGNAMSAVTSEGIYPYYNPAIVSLALERRQQDVSTSLMSFDRNLHKVGASFALPPKAGISLSIINASVSDIDGRTSGGYHTQFLSTNEYQVASAFGLRFSERFQVGVGIKYYLADYHPNLESVSSFGFDLGALFKASDRLRLGFVIQDLLAEYSWNTGEFYGESSSSVTNDSFPMQVRLGSSYNINDNLLISLEPGIMISSSEQNNRFLQLRAGGRYHLHELVTVRAGWEVTDLSEIKVSNNLSAGFSVHLPFDLFAPSVDYAFVPEPNNVSNMHVFGLQLNL